jgi:hypothetical protein
MRRLIFLLVVALATSPALAETTTSAQPRSDLCSKCQDGSPGETCRKDTDWCDWYSVNDFRSTIPGGTRKLEFVRGCDSTSWQLFNTSCKKFIRPLGGHQAKLVTVRCTCRCDQLDCRVEEEPAVFDVRWSEVFAVDPSIEGEQALEMVRAFHARRVVGLEAYPKEEPWENDMRVVSVSRESTGFEIELNNGACTLKLFVRLEKEKGGDARLRVFKQPEVGCS